MSKETVLIVEDDPEIQHLIQLYLEREYEILIADNGKMAIDTVLKHSPDIVLLDILLPEYNGLEVCQIIRSFNQDVPIIILSSRSEYEDRIIGLEAGADDYMIKPFDPGEVLARVKAHLRRNKIMSNRNADVTKTLHRFGDIQVNLQNYTVWKKNKAVPLYTKEKQLLFFFIKNANQVFSVEQLYDKIWGEDKFGDYKTVKVHISNLRKKIEDDPSKPIYIQTVRGFGYKFLLKK